MNLSQNDIDQISQVVDQSLLIHGGAGQVLIPATSVRNFLDAIRELTEAKDGLQAAVESSLSPEETDALQAEILDLKAKLTGVTVERDALAAERTSAAVKFNETLERVKHLESAFHEQRVRAERAENSLLEMTIQVDKLSEKLARKSLGTFSEEVEELKGKLDAATATLELSEGQNSTLQAKVTELREKIRVLEDAVPEPVDPEIAKENVALTARVEELLEQNRALSQALSNPTIVPAPVQGGGEPPDAVGKPPDAVVMALLATLKSQVAEMTDANKALEERLAAKIEESKHMESGMEANVEAATFEATVEGSEAARLEKRVERLIEASLGIVETFQRIAGRLPLEVEQLRRAVYDEPKLEEE